MQKHKKFILWFNEINNDDVGVVGGKNASLGEMYQKLTKKGVRIPNGFAVTAYAYQYLLKQAGVEDEIKLALKGLNVRNMAQLQKAGKKVRDIIKRCEFPPDLKKDIFNAYKKLSKHYKKKNIDVAVRSSATAEDLLTSNIPGLYGEPGLFKAFYALSIGSDAIREAASDSMTERDLNHALEQAGYPLQKAVREY